MTEANKFPADQMDRIAKGFPGRIGFYVKDLCTGLTYEYNADEPLPTASVCKVAVMIELFRQHEVGESSLSARHRVRDNISRHGTGALSLMKDQPELSVYDLCRMMMGVSDNVATDMLIGLLTPDAINGTMQVMGYHNTRTTMPLGVWHYLMKGIVEEPSLELDEKILDGSLTDGPGDKDLPFASDLRNNVASARDLCDIMEKIESREMISVTACEEMIAMMKVVRNPNRIRQYLRPEIQAARKTGGSGRIKADTGIVYLPNGPVVIAGLATADDRDQGTLGMEAIGQISRLVYEVLSPDSIVD